MIGNKALGFYRVWCLSWDEEEEHGTSITGYDFLNHDPAQQERGILYVPSFELGSAPSAAEAYANYAYGQRDGWESTWPLTFRVRSPDGSTSDFEVTCNHEPVFRAHSIGPSTDEAR